MIRPITVDTVLYVGTVHTLDIGRDKYDIYLDWLLITLKLLSLTPQKCQKQN